MYLSNQLDCGQYLNTKKVQFYSENKTKQHFIHTYTQSYQRFVDKLVSFKLSTCILIITKKVWISNKFKRLSTSKLSRANLQAIEWKL